MAIVAQYLVDTSALARMGVAAVSSVIKPLMKRQVLATAAPLDFEWLWTAQTKAQYEQFWQDRELLFEYLYTEEEHWRRALDVQRALAQRSALRSIPLVDSLVAALAEAHGLIVIHYDKDYETLSQLMNFTQQWVVPRGTI